jgi:hypothetical protein
MNTAIDQSSQGRALRNGEFASLLGYAATKAAKRLVDDVYARVAADQREHAKTQANENKLRNAVGAFVADLLGSHAGTRPRYWVWRPMSPRTYTGGPVGYDVFVKRLVPALERLGLLERRGSVAQYIEGFGGSNESGGRHEKTVRTGQWATRFRARPELLELSIRYGVPPETADQHFAYRLTLPREPLQVRTASTRPDYGGEKMRGRKMAFAHTALSRRLDAEVRELNEYLARQHIEGGTHAGYLRIFQNGDQEGFRWNYGGRLYSTPSGKNYQQLSKQDRKRKGETRRTPGRLKMTINDEAVAEVDIRASYLTILHALHGEQLDLDRDPYLLASLGKKGRHAVKLWMVATLGSGKPIERWPKELIDDYEEESGKAFDRRTYSVKRITALAVQQHPLLARLQEPIRGRVRGWPDLMFRESQAMVGAMLDLKRDHDIPSLAVHDSLLVPASKTDLAIQAIKRRFKAVTGKEAQVVPSSTTNSRRRDAQEDEATPKKHKAA